MKNKMKPVSPLPGEETITIKGGIMYAFFKKATDIILSFIAIVLLSPLLLILTLLVCFTSKGGPIFVDHRIGKYGKPIKVLKFRTMYIDAESNLSKYLTPEQIEQWNKERKLDNDPRITKIGKFLRKSSLDELPQLFNIFTGSLSIVGPRPVKEKELLDNYTEYQRYALLQARPGLTGYWQVYGRSDAWYEDGARQKLELAYLSKRSYWFDMKLIFMTVPVVIKQKGAK